MTSLWLNLNNLEAPCVVSWSDPYKEPVKIKISKEGFMTVEFKLDWDSYTYTSTVVLEPR